MNKKALLVLVLAVAAAGGVFAQEWYNSYAPGITDNRFFVNAGIGLGPSGGYDRGVPPISASVDFKLPVNVPITVGGIGTFSTWNRSIGAGPASVEINYRNIGFGVRGMYHFNFLQNLDTYAGLTLGYVYQSADVKYGSYWNNHPFKVDYPGDSFFLWGFNIGARYFFTDLVGAYLELGYSGLQFIGLGVSFKF